MIHDSDAPGRRLNGLLDKLGLGRPELRAWAMYDWANSAMVTTIITAVFPIYYAKVACADVNSAQASQRLSIATTIGMVLIAVASPLLGTIADFNGRKKRMLGGFLAVGLASVAGMFFIYRGDWILASVLFILANIGANGSFVFYDSLLPHIARDDEIDRVSTAGYALGYVGGGVLLALNLAWILKPEWFGLPSGDNLTMAQTTLPSRLAFLSVAVWWLIFSIPLFRRVREPVPAHRLKGEDADKVLPIRAAVHQLIETGHALRRYRQALLMLLAFLIYNDGIGTIYRMASIYGNEIGIDQGVIIAAILLVQFVGIPCAFLFGMIAQRIGAKRSIALGLLAYIGICLFGYFMSTATHFLILAILVGGVQGGTQALSRSLFASMIPRDKSGEFFGFFAVAEKFAGIFGPATFAVINALNGSSRGAIVSIIAFFVVGGFLLTKVDVAEGQRLARIEEAEALPI
ncbi:MAG TPA: MFS transporter [Isosphaeraceae bacterium]|nr:MFS transporter [Isosphaeraceae bacterium]